MDTVILDKARDAHRLERGLALLARRCGDTGVRSPCGGVRENSLLPVRPMRHARDDDTARRRLGGRPGL